MRGGLLEKLTTQLYATYHICGDHFTTDDFMDTGMTSLKKAAIPAVQPTGCLDCQLAKGCFSTTISFLTLLRPPRRRLSGRSSSAHREYRALSSILQKDLIDWCAPLDCSTKRCRKLSAVYALPYTRVQKVETQLCRRRMSRDRMGEQATAPVRKRLLWEVGRRWNRECDYEKWTTDNHFTSNHCDFLSETGLHSFFELSIS
ncbi:uncharacterized protein LOC144125279 [Amblyomma americanum]